MTTKRGFIKLFIPLLTSVFFSTGASAKSCLWKITSETGTLYLQGSVHVLKAEHYPLAPAIEVAYENSAALVLEVDMKEMTSPETQQQIMLMAMLPEPETLPKILDADTYQELSAACIQAGIPTAALEKFKPWFAAMTLRLVKMKKMGFDPQYGLDQYFNDKATADAKPVIGLESVKFQIYLFDSLAESNPHDFVAHTLADLELITEEVDHLDKAWATGDIDAVGKLMAEGFEDFPEFYKTFVLDRNKRWVKKLETLLKEPKTHMVVVGAGHLSGKGGLLELLRNQGYTLEQL